MLQRDRQRQRERGTFSGGGAGAFTAEYLVVAGGGGGAGAIAGGGGGGAVVAGSAEISLTSYALTVGSGGAASIDDALQGSTGSSSTFSSITADGGGGGGTRTFLPNGLSAGTGGGGGRVGVGGTGSQGGDGGDGNGSTASGSGTAGGGGGASTNGADGATNGGNGGDGIQSIIVGLSSYYGGGGGGGADSRSGSGRLGGTGGLGGGGNGSNTDANAQNGTVNTGGGGGGGGLSAAILTNGGNGGSGVVIIRVPSTVVAEFSAGVVYNYIPLDDFNVYEITAAGVSDTVTFSQGAVTTVGESLLFNDDDSAYLSRTPSSAGNTNVFTYSGWIKLGNVDTGQKTLLSAGPNNNSRSDIWVYDNKVWFSNRVASTTYTTIYANALLRDPSAWYHIVVKADQTKSFVDIYINGVKQETTVTSANYGVATLFNTTNVHAISRLSAFASSYFDGYMSDVYFIDGEALDPSRFGKQDADGIWQPISYTGSYGTNGFHLEFADNSTAAALGTDTSGNGNDWTPSGITTDDQVTDTPSVNYATWNGLDTGNLLADGNLQILAFGTSGWKFTRGAFAIPSGKWYWEASNAGANIQVGISERTTSLTTYFGQGAASFGYYNADGYLYRDNFYYAFGDTWGSGDVIGIAFDADTRELTFYKNNVSQGSYTVPEAEYFPAAAAFNSSVTHNFGQRPFAYTPPTGFQALNSSNLPAPTITDGKAHFAPALYTGNGTTQAIGGLEFQPDMVWIKSRSTAYDHQLHDAVRGAGIGLLPNLTVAEQPTYNTVTAFNSNGFTVAVNGSFVGTNGAGSTFVGWSWNAGGSTVANTDGTITSQVRANTDAGISIVSYSQGASGATVGHGLGAAPDIVIAKSRTVAGPNWAVYHSSIGKDLVLELSSTSAAISLANYWGASTPSSTTFGVATTGFANNTGDMIAYCFASVDGFSKFGSYTGNGSTDGPFVYTGFRPAFVMVKRTDAANSWLMMDDKRSPYNYADEILWADLSDAEALGGTNTSIDFLSNGFKARGNGGSINTSGGTYIFMAFAENPFKLSRAR